MEKKKTLLEITFQDLFDKNLSRSNFCKKYDISESSYRLLKKKLLQLCPEIDPRLLYKDERTIQQVSHLENFNYAGVKISDRAEAERLAANRLGCELRTSSIEPKTPERPSQSKSNVESFNFNPSNIIDTSADKSLLVKGVSTLYDADGNVKVQWVKTQRDEEEYYEALKGSITKLCKKVPACDRINVNPSFLHNKTADDIQSKMVFLPLADMHLGLDIDANSVASKTKWNLEIAEKVFLDSIDYILNTAPVADSIVITDLGDLTHNDSNENVTKKSKHSLDVDGRYEKIMLKTFELMIQLIHAALPKYNHVYFYSLPGNHNDNISLPLKCVLKHHFLNNPQVHIDIDDYTNVYYHKFGKNILMFSHGDEIKPHSVETILVSDNLDCLSNYKNFDCYLGHYHTEKQQQKGLVTVNYVKNFIPNDKWSTNVGFRNSRNIGYMKAYVYDAEQGVVSTISYNPTHNKY